MQELAEVLGRSKQAEFKAPPDDGGRYFGSLPNQAAFAAGLYWNAFMKHPSNKGHRFKHLKDHQPQPARTIFGLLRQVRRMEEDRLCGTAARNWCDRFERQAYTLRDIGPRLRVVEGDGRMIEPGQFWLRRETDILDRFPVQTGADGKEEVRLPDSLDNHLLEEKNRVKAMITVRFPHTRNTAILPNNAELIDNWCRKLNGRSGPESLAWDLYPESMQAAEKLVRCTGLVVSDDESLSVDASSIVL
jgi:hypothetical protein